ncbi:MAG: glycosyltransferase [Tenacibaculum sp.]|nr:glycosyltransferase [Tenacibaculum sp.]
MKEENKFSVLLSVYIKEKPEFLKSALNSIYLEQTLKPDEIVLVKDGPLTKELDDVIDKFKQNLKGILKIIVLKKNMGLGYALNEGIKECSYELIARMDTDDIATPYRFEKQVSFFKSNPDVDVLGGMIEEFEEVPGDLGQFRMLPFEHDKILSFAKFRNPINHPTVTYKKSKILEVGGYTSDILFWEDYLLWVKLLNNGCVFHNLDSVLLSFRVQNGNHMIKKRRGIKYAVNEVKFARFARKIRFFNNYDFIKYISLKPPGRLLPSVIISKVYNTIFRKKSSIKKNNLE